MLVLFYWNFKHTQSNSSQIESIIMIKNWTYRIQWIFSIKKVKKTLQWLPSQSRTWEIFCRVQFDIVPRRTARTLRYFAHGMFSRPFNLFTRWASKWWGSKYDERSSACRRNVNCAKLLGYTRPNTSCCGEHKLFGKHKKHSSKIYNAFWIFV